MKIRALLALAALFSYGQVAQAQTAPACPFGQTVGDASVWDSGTPQDIPGGVFPIGGSGQVNGQFNLCEAPGLQLGLRASERFVGPIAPAGNLYQVAPGTDWNVEWHIDFAFAYGQGIAPLNLGETSTVIQLDCDPLVGVANGPTIDLLNAVPPAPANLILGQSSQNPSFLFFCGPDFDFDIDGSYEFSIVSLDAATDRLISSTEIVVQVGDNPPIPPMPPVEPPVQYVPQPVPSVGALGQVGLIALLAMFGLLAARRRF